MYRYYITRKTPEGVMEHPTTTAPNVIESYGQNGSQFEGFTERFWGYVEFEKELPGSDLDAYGLVPGPSPEYYPINENMARRAKEMMSFSEYVPGSATWDYRLQVDKASMVAQRQKQRTDPMYHEKIDGLLAAYSRRLAANLNDGYRIGTMCPSVLISGGSNFPVRKKERQNAASDKNMAEWQEINGIIGRIKSVGTGGISSDDPLALDKLKLKLRKLEEFQEEMKVANAAIRMKDQAKGDAKLAELGYSPEDIAKLRAPDFCGRIGYPSYQLQNNNANIRRIRQRIAELEKKKENPAEGWEFDGGKVVVNQGVNRLQIIFDDRPDADLRSELKGEGFRWAPSQGAWQRQLTDNAMRAARRIKAIAPAE